MRSFTGQSSLIERIAMKIAIISRGIPSTESPLYGLFEFDQAKALAKKGLDVAFIVIDYRNCSYHRKYGLMQYQKDGVSVFELSLPLGIYRRALPILQRLLLIPFRSMLKSFGKPDIVHAHFYSIAAIATILKQRYGIPFIITEHSSKLNKDAASISKIDKTLASKAYQFCDQLICVSQALRNSISRNFKHESIVIPNMVDDMAFQLHTIPSDASPFVFVSVGNLIPIKGFDILIKAFAQIKEGTKLYIIGDGPERENIKGLICQYQLEQHVELLGQLERTEINKVFQQSHVFVLPSRSETFGICYIEAMYAGLPVIATRCGGPESFVDSRNGLLVSIDDVDALSHAMMDIRLNYANYDPLHISQNCINQFSPSIIASQIIEVYCSQSQSHE